MFEENFAPFSKRWCTFLKDIFQIIINMHFKECHYHQKKNIVHTNDSYFEMVLESISKRPQCLWNCMRIEGFFFNYAIFQRECMKSGHTFFTEYHILWKIWLGIITDIGGFYVKMPNPCPNGSSSALFCLFFFGIWFDKCHIRQKTRWE